MNTKRSCLWGVFLLAFAGCTKTDSPMPSHFETDLAPNAAYTKVVSTLTDRGFAIEQSDPAALTLTTGWKEIAYDDLRAVASAGSDAERLKKGRYLYRIGVMDHEGKTHLHIEAAVEGLYLTKQTAQGGSKEDEWHPEKSTGKLETALYDAIARAP